MKKILFILILVVAAGTVLNAQSTSLVDRVTYKPYFYKMGTNDTLNIFRSDRIAGVTVIVPTSANDSVRVFGANKYLDGFPSGYISLAPGEGITIGYNDQLMLDSVEIICKHKANIIATPSKR